MRVVRGRGRAGWRGLPADGRAAGPRRRRRCASCPRFAFVDGTSLRRHRRRERARRSWSGPGPAGRRRPGWPASTRRRPRCRATCSGCYVWFSAPMSEGHAGGQVRLGSRRRQRARRRAAARRGMSCGTRPRRRLTVLLDPARIKRGLVGHREAGYPLRPGEPFRLVVGSGFRDAQGLPLRAPAQRRYHVGGDERRHVEPGRWALAVPPPARRAAARSPSTARSTTACSPAACR